MEQKEFTNELDKIIHQVYYAVRDASRVFKIPPGAIGINIANIYKRAVIAETGSVVSTYRNSIVLVAEEWLHAQTNYVDVYYSIAKEVRYIYQTWNVNRYKNNDELFGDINLIEVWAVERENHNINDDDFKSNLTFDSNKDAIAFANYLTINNLETNPTLTNDELDCIASIDRDFEVMFKDS